MKNRMEIDWSNHELIIDKKDGYVRHTFKHKEYNQMQRVNFINTDGVLLVTGDYGNWVFCREFHPEAFAKDNVGVSDGYWCEKLSIHSEQNYTRYNPDETDKQIQELIDSGLEEWGYEGERLEEAKDWFEELLEVTSDEIEYNFQAYRGFGKPDFIDYELIPFVETTLPRLKIIFDAFEQIVNALKQTPTPNNGADKN